MGYRKSKTEEELEWREWLDINSDLVRESGLSEDVLKDYDHWCDFINHGFLSHHADPTGFNLSFLTPRQLVTLLRLMQKRSEDFNSEMGRELVWEIKLLIEKAYK